MSFIHIENLSKQFKILNRREGLGGAFRGLSSGDYRTLNVVAGISFDIEPGKIVGSIGPVTLTIWTKGVNSYTGTGS